MVIPAAKELVKKVFAIKNDKQFEEIALQTFKFQYFNNPVYRNYCEVLKRSPEQVLEIKDIPFLPISFFKTHEVKTTGFEPEVIFRSSGTTGVTTSKHLVKDKELYKKSFLTCFRQFYGSIEKLCVIGLLPSYLEQGNSSLVFMVDELIKRSGHPFSGSYLYDHEKLHQNLLHLEREKQKTILFGVSYALLDFAEQFPMKLRTTTVIETGGMKGRRTEMTRNEFYEVLKKKFGVAEIHSEYGMTELLSQAYGVNGIFNTPPWMKILLRDETDPFSYAENSGAINVIDLANIYSCSFIATEDVGKFSEDGFEILGRMDNSDVRGCSQLVI